MSKTDEQSGSTILDTIKTLLVAGIIAISFRSVVAEPFNIPSGSMIPTLLVGDYLFVSKYSYGYSRYSFPFGIAPINGRMFEDTPQRGDVAVFRLPSNPSVDYIKRVIGLPGDVVQVKQGILHLNNTPVNRRLIGTVQPSSLQSTADTVYRETLPDGREHMIQEVNDIQLFDNTQAFTIPEGHYFMMGDNRDNSRDSRSSSVGVVPIENFIGKAQFIFFSVDQSARIWEIWKWPTSVRFSRIGSSIE